MKSYILPLLACFVLLSCSKSSSDSSTSSTPVNNGPIGGTYNFTSLTAKTYDTIPGSGILTMNEYTTTTTNLKGSISVTANNISSKGLMYDYSTSGTQKEMNTSTNAIKISPYGPMTGSRGTTSTAYNSNYTIDTNMGELTIDDAQYLFNPAFVSQPLNKKHTNVLTGNVLKVTTNTYTASSQSRMISEATFTKQ